MALRTTIDQLGIDLLQNILARLPAVDFASANGTCSLFHHVCGLVLCRPKLSSAFSLNPSFQAAVEEVVNKVLSEPMRPHFAIVTAADWSSADEIHRLIITKLGSNVPVITNCSRGFMGRDAFYDEFKEIRWDNVDIITGVMLMVGFLPGVEVKKIPLLRIIDEQVPKDYMIDQFVTDIKEFSSSISGCESPAAIIMFSFAQVRNIKQIMEKLDYEMSPETVIVGDFGSSFKNTLSEGILFCSAAVALVFVKHRNKPLGIGDIHFHPVLSSGMLPLGPGYEVTSFKNNIFHETSFTAKREGSHENLNGEIILRQAHEEGKNHGSYTWLTGRRGGLHDEQHQWYIGVTKRRKRSDGLMTSFAFHEVQRRVYQGELCIYGSGVETGDNFRFYLPDSTTALSSVVSVSNRLRSFKQGNASGDDKREVFGGLVFTSYYEGESFFGQPSVESSSFLDNFPNVTLGVSICDAIIGRENLSMYVKESQDVFSSVTEYGVIYLIMSYTP